MILIYCRVPLDIYRRIPIKNLLLDLESAPNTAHVWGIWKQNIGINQLMESSYVLCWAAKWLDDPKIMFESIYKNDSYEMLIKIHSLLDEADVVTHFNGSKFDIPTLNKEFIEHGINPPSPYKQVDLLKIARNQFRFPSNKLAYIAKKLGLTEKVQNIGHELWIKCMNNDPEAWKMMKEYNKGDVITLQELYYRFLPWIKNHPNHGLYQEDKAVCPTCGSKHYHRRGTLTTRAGIYERYQCQSCGTWFRGNKNQQSPARQNLLVAHG